MIAAPGLRKSEALLLSEEEARFIDPALVDAHLAIQFAGTDVAGLDFLELHYDCLARTGTPVDPAKQLRRAQRGLTVARYFVHTADVAGGVAECGVFRGYSMLLMSRIARALDPAFTGGGLHAVDSFEGLSPPGAHDAPMRKLRDDGTATPMASHAPGHFAVDESTVRAAFADFPDLAFHRGWVPQVLETLPDEPWRFVHLDLDLYAPTAGALDWFWPRLATGGVIVNDDFASPLFPGARRAWIEFAERHGLTFQPVDTGQAVLMKL